MKINYNEPSKDVVTSSQNSLKINYNEPISREHIDWESYDAKFKKADDWLASPTPDMKTYRELLLDKTTFCYLNFRVNGARLKLYSYQDMIINDNHRFKYFSASNQIGKSLMLEADDAADLIIDHGFGHNSAIVSQNLAVSTDRMRNIKALLNSSPTFNWKEEKGEADNMSVLTCDIKGKDGKVKYTNKLILAPCSAGLLSYALHKLSLDEFEFWEIDVKHFFNQIAEPRTYRTKGRITIFSNPNGAEHYGAELEQLTLPDGNKKFHLYNFSFLDCPGNTVEELEIAKVGKSRAVIESTLLGIRTLSDKYYFSSDEVDQSYSDKLNREKEWIAKGKQSYWFLDVGAKHDMSVLCGGMVRYDEIKKDHKGNWLMHIDVFAIHVYPQGYPISRVVGSFDESQATDGWHQEKSVKEYLEEYQVTKNVNPPLGVDVTGNSGISPLFQSIGVRPIDITFSGPKKWSMYQRMKYFLEQKLLHVIKNKEYDYQMKRIVVTKLKTGTYNRVGHENEDDHDDVPDAICGLIHVADNPNIVTPTMVMI